VTPAGPSPRRPDLPDQAALGRTLAGILTGACPGGRVDAPDPGGTCRHRVAALAGAAADREPRLRELEAEILAQLAQVRLPPG
jgi:hypothetical protein